MTDTPQNPTPEVPENTTTSKTENALPTDSRPNETDNEEAQKPQPAVWRKWCAIGGVVATVIAWLLLPFTAIPSLVLAVLSVVACSFGIRSRLRTLSITFLLCASVLCLVFAVYYAIIIYLLNAL